ncbi:MAG: hypothetical protein IJ246_02715 [Clostridia bacterium]|nr:hypothetical protein [Clostridia bacterium]
MGENLFAWLPDEFGSVRLERKMGASCSQYPARFLSDAAQAMDGGAREGMLGWLNKAPDTLDASAFSHWKGLLSAALLLECLSDSFTVDVKVYTRASSAFIGMLLEESGREMLKVCRLRHGRDTAVLGIVDARWGVCPVPGLTSLTEILGGILPWWKDDHFEDPKPYLQPRERRLLRERLSLLGEPAMLQFAMELAAVDAKAENTAFHDMTASYEKAIKAMCAMEAAVPEGPFHAVVRPLRAVRPSAVLTSLSISEKPSVLPEEKHLYWNNILLAKTDVRRIVELEDSDSAREALRALALEEELLEKYSKGYIQQLVTGMQKLTGRTDTAPQAARMLDSWMQRSETLLHTQVTDLEMRYPWRASSPALREILMERLGDVCADAFMHVFSDRLLLCEDAFFPGEGSGLLPVEGTKVFCILPFSEKVGQLSEEQRDTLIRSTHILADGHSGIRVSAGLASGESRVTVTRLYRTMEQITLTGAEIPEISMFPGTPLAESRFQGYWLSVRGRMEVRTKDGDQQVRLSGEDTEEVFTSLHRFPEYFSLYRGAQCLGLLPGMAPIAESQEKKTADVSLVLYERGIRMAMRVSGTSRMLEEPCLRRRLLSPEPTLCRPSRFPDALYGGFLGDKVFVQNDATEPEVFRDGYLTEMQGDATHTYPLLRTDAMAQAARSVMIQEAVYLLAYASAKQGADGMRVHLVLPSGLDDDTQSEFREACQKACERQAETCGVTIHPPKTADDRNVLTMRYLFGENGFTPLCTLHLEDTEWGVGLMAGQDGTPSMAGTWGFSWNVRVLTELTRSPDLMEEFRLLPGFPVEQLETAAAHALENAHDWEESLRLIDLAFYQGAAETTLVMQGALAQNRPMYLHALWIMDLCMAMTLCGAACEEAYMRLPLPPFPPVMPLLVTGSCAHLYASLDPAIRYQMGHFPEIACSQGHGPFQVLCAGIPGQEAALRACLENQPADVRLRDMTAREGLETLAAHFLMQFYNSFPRQCELLFPGRLMQSGILMRETSLQLHAICETMGDDGLFEALPACVERLRKAYHSQGIIGNGV